MLPVAVFTFSDVVAMANQFASTCKYGDATLLYLQAATLAPTAMAAKWMVDQAWCMDERAHGRRSELEP
jgi:hypothetical protein